MLTNGWGGDAIEFKNSLSEHKVGVNFWGCCKSVLAFVRRALYLLAP